MSSAISRLYQRVSRNRSTGSSNASPHLQRTRTLSIPLPPGTHGQTTTGQSQSIFFTKLPLEIRISIYKEVLKNSGSAIHVIKKRRKELEIVQCRIECAMPFLYQCHPTDFCDSSASVTDFRHLLQSCRLV